tara:strand:+ start:317 stop:1075 length:759 start_codon:yes stop_codon:yes gene_type:complete
VHKTFNYNYPFSDNIRKSNTTYDQLYSKLYDDIYYEKKRYDYETQIVLNIMKKYINHETYKWLDIACGTSKHFTKRVNLNIEYIGLDKSKHMLHQAFKNKSNYHKKFIQFDYRNLNLIKNKFDIITSYYCGLYYVKDIESILNDISKILSGYFILSYIDKNNLEVLTLDNRYMKYKNGLIKYQGRWENYKNETYYHEYFYDNNKLICYNKHIMYIPNDIKDILKKYFKIVKEINYKDKFDAADEYLFVLRNK